jgi:hypothetical protein
MFLNVNGFTSSSTSERYEDGRISPHSLSKLTIKVPCHPDVLDLASASADGAALRNLCSALRIVTVLLAITSYNHGILQDK